MHDSPVHGTVKSEFSLRSILHAAEAGDLKRVAECLREDPASVRQIDDWGATAMHKAASTGHLHVIQLLIVFGGDVNARNRNGSTPLHRAAMYGHVTILDELASAGGDVNMMNNGGVTPLHRAAGTGKSAAIRRLCELGARTGVHSQDGETPTDIAKACGHKDVVEILEEFQEEDSRS